MTEKNIFAYKLFLSLNISDFNIFLCENWSPRLKSHPLFPSNLSPKFEVLSSTPFLKILLEAQRFSIHAERWGRGGAHYDNLRLAKISYMEESETLFER